MNLDDIELHNIDRWHAHGYPWEDFAVLRREAPVYWYDRPGVDPHWTITRHADVKAISADNKTFINSGPQLRLVSQERQQRFDQARDRKVEMYGWDIDEPEDLVYLDAPRHTQMRMLTARHFTPLKCRQMAAKLDENALKFVEAFEAKLADGPADLINDFAVGLPLATICDMLGVPTSDWEDVHRWTDAMLDVNNMRWANPGEDRRSMRKRLHAEFHAYVDGIIARKRAEPADDLASLLVHAAIDGEPLTHQQLHGYLMLLIGAGNETTRNATSRGILALLDHPDQIELLRADPGNNVLPLVDEIVRFTSPVIQFVRTATRDTVVRDQKVRAGEMVVMWYPSANRDEAVFDNPDALDITRSPNDHVGFGHGAHFCLGSNLAKWELRSIFGALAKRPLLSQLEVAGPARWMTDLHVGTISEVAVRLSA